MENIYYVYEWIRLDTNEPFYVGKGHENRWRVLNRGNNYHFNNIVNSVPCIVNILHDNLDEQVAFDLEVWYIWQYRDVIGYDLCNITDGGEGVSGYNHTEKWRQEQSERFSGENNPFYGKKHTEEAIRKNKEKHIGVYPTEETREKLSNMRKGEGNNMWGRRGELSPHWGKKYSEERKDNISKALGTSVRCIELDIEFNSLNKAEQYMVEIYNIKFSHKTLKSTIDGNRKKDWYGEIEINGELVKLHWEYC